MLQAWPWRCLRPAKRLHQRTGAYPESLQGSIPSGHLLSECRVEQRRGAGAPKAEANIRQEASQDFKNFKATVQGTRPRPGSPTSLQKTVKMPFTFWGRNRARATFLHSFWLSSNWSDPSLLRVLGVVQTSQSCSGNGCQWVYTACTASSESQFTALPCGHEDRPWLSPSVHMHVQSSA